MTCREFRHTAASLTLWELAQLGDKQILDHAGMCLECGAWLDRQQTLAVSMQTLRTQTADREADPQVERALLRVFRQETLQTQPVASLRSAPVAFRLSRFFELGTYAAVAAAIAVAMFLGARLPEHRTVTPPLQTHSVPAVNMSPAQQTQTAANAKEQQPAGPLKREVESSSTRRPHVAAASLASDDPDYVVLMFCDPLICSSDAEVVRMELPVVGAGENDTRTQVADVVVGDDGLVRAMRIVN
jgi:hypothetical protein